MASIAASGIVLELLTKDNYDNWSCLVRNYLAGHGLWEVVTSDSPVGVLSDEAYEIWNMKNAKALHIIQLACGSENLTHVRDVGTAKDAWNYFITAHDSESNTKESVVQSDIEQTKESIVQSDIEQGEVEVSLLHNRSLYWFIQSGNWNDANAFMKRDKTSMFSTSSSGRTILHVAVIAGHEEIVKKLVKKGKDKLVEMKDNRGYTALSLVAEFNGNINMTKCMVENKGEQVFGEDLLYMKTNDGKTPLLLAAARGHKEMTSYLYSHTNRLDEMADNNFHTCSMLFTLCINAGIFDVALNLLQQFPQMPLAFSSESRYEFDGVHPLYALSCMPYVFPSSSTYGLIQGFFYKVLRLPEEQLKRYFADGRLRQILKHIHILFQNFVLLKLSGIREIYDQKMTHHRVLEILNCLYRRVQEFNELELREASAYDAMLQAAKYGNIEFIDAMRKANPNLLGAINKNGRGILAYAILNRRKAIFQLIHDDPTVNGFNGLMEILRSSKDAFGNSLLHLAGYLEPSSSQRRYSPALQMQKEILWFKTMESAVHPRYKEAKNNEGKNPREVFTESHEKLVKEGATWAKETAGSFTLVATLITTIMFAAAFTVPGGNNQDSGIPLFLKDKAFNVFIIADAISLFTSSTSVLLFIGILTAHYAENDFLKSLPLKLCFAIFALFLSVVSMMVAFCASLAMLLKGDQGVIITTISLASIPVIVLVPSQLQLFFEIFKSTILSD